MVKRKAGESYRTLLLVQGMDRRVDSPATLEELKGLYHGVVNPYPHQGCFRQEMAPQLGKLVAKRMRMVKARPQEKAPGVSSITEGF